MAAALNIYWWYAAAANAPTNGPTQKIHCIYINPTKPSYSKRSTYLVIPHFFIVVNNSSTKAPSWVDPSSSNGYGGQMHHENSKPNWQWSQNLHKSTSFSARCTRNVRITCTPFRVSGREDSVNKDKGANNLSTKCSTLVVARCNGVGTTTQ
ncbi:hypothetical protein Ccrd_001881 [Cynara cardunculus var. scolymus]|uniref:Uncharacterized protein n=1 Tax=Cynara cardunculus var. scolymus TaxID=59895 RepID=A0A103XSE7_CYNCS|nr:hypothetical protein Ccrd_001881 [Cynara cardunculus var. scolymus]